ncbi:MAG: hypothetical protein KAV87_52030 [Desulfobacteraceae bacterium]|nr:hypothetical protein [Desulfobacteraceae bacterium]
MNKDHYVSLKIAQKLHEAGVEFLESEKVWISDLLLPDIEPQLWTREHLSVEIETRKMLQGFNYQNTLVIVPAPSLSELLDELSVRDKDRYFSIGECCESPEVEFDPDKQYVCEIWGDCELIPGFAKTLPDAAALMLLKLKEREGK